MKATKVGSCVVLLLAGCADGRDDGAQSQSPGSMDGSAGVGETTEGGGGDPADADDGADDAAPGGSDGADDDGVPDPPSDAGSGPWEPVDECTVSPGGLDAPQCDPASGGSGPVPREVWRTSLDCQANSWGLFGGARTAPVVANLTDDNGDGVVDLCDVPDVVLACATWPDTPGMRHIYVLDGATGAIHTDLSEPIPDPSQAWSHGGIAVADLEGDGSVEILHATFTDASTERVRAWHLDGTTTLDVEFANDGWAASSVFGWRDLPTVADVDGDGVAEISTTGTLLDAGGAILHQVQANAFDNGAHATTSVDLDGDGDLELVGLGRAVWHHTGVKAFDLPAAPACAIGGSYDHYGGAIAVADFDLDGEPEIAWHHCNHLTISGPTGQVEASLALDQGAYPGWWGGGLVVADLDGDGPPEILLGGWGGAAVYAFDGGLHQRWAEGADAWETYGYWGGGVTAFDLDGDGRREVIAGAAGGGLAVFSAEGILLSETSGEGELMGSTPVVVDADNDGAAEIVTVAWGDGASAEGAVSVALYEAAGEAWPPTRRIWNQHGYHVTNIREDATVPSAQPAHWTTHNTFNVQAEPSARPCDPSGPAG